jgi:malonate transporter
MLSILSVIGPVFAIILAGFLARKSGAMGPTAASELNRFVVYLALPALIFDIMAHASWHELYQPGFIAAFGLACGALFYATVVLSLLAGQRLAEASIDGLNAAYANTAFIGFPLCLMVFGRESLIPVAIASIITVCILFASAIVLIETGLQSGKRPHQLASKVAVSLIRNPILVAPALGALYGAAGLAVPESADRFMKLLGGAASPCALVVLGLFLAERREISAGERGTSGILTLGKLFIHPLLTWVLAYWVFAVPPALAAMAVVLAALPTGTGPFMLAEFYGRRAVVTSGTILLSTIGSILTLTLYLSLAGPH